MSFNWKRRILLALASASALLMAACGSGTIESQLQPSRIVVFGDGMADLGQAGGRRYTVNDNTVNVWTQDMASRFGLPLAAAAAGGSSFAIGNARVIAKPDAAGSAATPTVVGQIDSFLAGGSIGANDLMLVSAGTADIVAEMALVTAGAQTGEQMIANVSQTGRDLAAQVRRLVQAGGAHVVVSGPYNLGRSPWALAIGQAGLLEQASTKFNEALLVALVDLGANVLYVDAALFFNLMQANPAGYDLSNVTQGVCSSVDPGPGIGIGNGQVNSALCDTTTLRSTDYNRFMFADAIYPSPQSHRRFGQYAFDHIHARW
jgi:phospholipase/lecithinase/hemolysin